MQTLKVFMNRVAVMCFEFKLSAEDCYDILHYYLLDCVIVKSYFNSLKGKIYVTHLLFAISDSVAPRSETVTVHHGIGHFKYVVVTKITSFIQPLKLADTQTSPV